MVRTTMNIVSEEGIRSVYSGLPAAIIRSAVYGGIGIGLYAPIRRVVCGDETGKNAALWYD